MSSTIQLDGFPHFSPSCVETHFGLWCIDDLWANNFLSSLQSGVLQAYLASNGPIAPVQAKSPDGYDKIGSRAVVPLVGSLSPRGSKFGGGSTLDFRRGLRAASRDDEVEEIIAYVNSPGGVVEGTREAAQELAKINRTVKPVVAHIQDQGTSAAYYIASGAQRITANESAFVGNIGVRGQIIDTSAAFEMNGLKSVMFSTGPFKAIGAPGEPVTDAQRAHIQGLIDQTFELFTGSVAEGRGLSGRKLSRVLDGKTYIASDALNLGLIDEITDVETLLSSPTSGGLAMSDEQVAKGFFERLFESGKLKIVASEEPPAIEPGRVVPMHTEPAQPARYEPTYADGVKAARAEAVEIVGLCILRYGETGQAAKAALSHIEAGDKPDELRRQFVTERVIESEAADNEISTARKPETQIKTQVGGNRSTVTLRPASEVTAERDRMAAGYTQVVGRN